MDSKNCRAKSKRRIIAINVISWNHICYINKSLNQLESTYRDRHCALKDQRMLLLFDENGCVVLENIALQHVKKIIPDNDS